MICTILRPVTRTHRDDNAISSVCTKMSHFRLFLDSLKCLRNAGKVSAKNSAISKVILSVFGGFSGKALKMFAKSYKTFPFRFSAKISSES